MTYNVNGMRWQGSWWSLRAFLKGNGDIIDEIDVNGFEFFDSKNPNSPIKYSANRNDFGFWKDNVDVNRLTISHDDKGNMVGSVPMTVSSKWISVLSDDFWKSFGSGGNGKEGNGGFDFASNIDDGLSLFVDGSTTLWNNFSNKTQWSYSYKSHQYLKNKGYNVKTSTIKNGIPKSLKVTGKGLSYLDAAITVTDVVYNSQINASHVLSATVTGLSFIPVVGWIIGGGYFVGDMITRGITGQSIGEHLDSSVGVPLYNWDW